MPGGLIARFGSAQAALEAIPDLARRGGGKPPRLTTADEAQRERHGQLELPGVLRHRGGLDDGLRGEPGGDDGHSIVLKKSEISRLARSGRS